MENQNSFWDKLKNPFAYGSTIVIIFLLRGISQFAAYQRNNQSEYNNQSFKVENLIIAKESLGLDDLIGLYGLKLSIQKKQMAEKGFKITNTSATSDITYYNDVTTEEIIIYKDKSISYAASDSFLEKLIAILNQKPYKLERESKDELTMQTYYSNESANITIGINSYHILDRSMTFVTIRNFQ
jgi:hypothetical protein